MFYFLLWFHNFALCAYRIRLRDSQDRISLDEFRIRRRKKGNIYTTVNYLWHVHRLRVVTLFWGCHDSWWYADDDSVAFGGCDPSVVWRQRSYPLDDGSIDTTRGVIPWFVAYPKDKVAKTKFPEGQGLSAILDINNEVNMAMHSFWNKLMCNINKIFLNRN